MSDEWNDPETGAAAEVSLFPPLAGLVNAAAVVAFLLYGHPLYALVALALLTVLACVRAVTMDVAVFRGENT